MAQAVKHRTGCNCCSCRTLRILVSGCGPAGITGNPTQHVVPSATVEVRNASLVLVGSGTTNSSGIVDIAVPAAGTHTVSAVDPHGTLSGSTSLAVTCGSGITNVGLSITATVGHACLPGVLYRALEETMALTDAQGTRSLVYSQNLRGISDRIWDCCAIISTTHRSTGSCVESTGNVRVLYELSSSLTGGSWKPILRQHWSGWTCTWPDRWKILAGGPCPPPIPAEAFAYSNSHAQVATSWSDGPPFTASFTFPTAAHDNLPGSDEQYIPMPGTVTISEI